MKSKIICGVSSKIFGDCRTKPEAFLQTLKLKKNNLVLAEQTHGNKIKIVDQNHRGKTIPNVDGLITTDSGIVLGVRSADCLPILFYEPKAKIIGVCHAGWKGILSQLPQKMVDLLIKQGALPENIIVTIGPHICEKCYEIKKDRADCFEKEFGQLFGMLTNKNGKIYLDLDIPAIFQLISSGIKKGNISLSDECTGCQNDKYFSYRKDRNKSYGEMLSVISLI